MLDSIRKGQRWFTILIIAGVGIVFVFFMGSGASGPTQGPTGNAVIELDGDRIELNDYQRARTAHENRFAEQFGDQFDAERLGSFIDTQTLQQLLSATILASEAREIGFRVSKDEVRDLVRESPSFRDSNGRFDAAGFKSYAQWEYGSEANFLRSIERDLLRSKMVRLLFGQAMVSDAEARSAAERSLEQVRVGYVALDAEKLARDLDTPEAAVSEYLAANTDSLKLLYEERIDDYREEDKVRVQHILIAAAFDDDEATTEAARAKAQSVLERALGGEPFDELAQALSDDPGTRDSGGDLGFIARGETAPQLEKVAFEGEPGLRETLVRTDQGFHVVIVLEQLEGSVTPFEEVSLSLARNEYARTEAERRAEETANRLSEAVKGGKSLEAAAEAEGLLLEKTVMLKRRPDGFIAGLGGAPEALATAFILSLDEPSSPEIFRVDGKYALIQVLERSEPNEDEIEDALAGVTSRILNERRSRLVDEWINQKREELQAAGRLTINPHLVIGS